MGDQHGEESESSFLRTDDCICLNCHAAPAASRDTGGGDRVCLAAEGFGNRMCFLQSMENKDLPFDISVCVFVLEQALSVRALQEMMKISSNSQETAGQSGHRTLLYGHAVLLKHSHSNMYLSCLSTQSSSSDKLAFDVGLQLMAEGESCWWTIHPASKQRSEGEKVRVGDDLILVSVASERYLHIGAGQMVMASFQQTLWTVQPVSSGAVRIKSVGYVFGGDVLRLLHGDEVLTIPPREGEHVHNTVMYETGSVFSHARSLWKIEHLRTKWAEGFIGWAVPCRLRHITSGRYLAVGEDNQVVTFHRSVASEEASAFYLCKSKDEKRIQQEAGPDEEGMGTADTKYGDSVVYIQHMKSGLWLSYQTFETKKRGVGRVEEKKAVMMVEGHMDDGLTLSRSQKEEDKSARVIRKCTSLISRFVKALESLKTEGRNSKMWETISLAEVIMTLEDLIEYFAYPTEDLAFEDRQDRLRALRNRQDLFQEEGMIALILETIDRCGQWKSLRSLGHLIGEESASKWNDMTGYLYLLLAAMIRGNHANCSQFAAVARLDWVVGRLDSAESSTGVLDVLHCVLIDSPEALNVIREQHIRTIISLIDKQGRDPKVLDVLCALCVGSGVAVRSNQNLICDNLFPRRDLLLQTKVIDSVYSMHPNMFVGYINGSSMFARWYYEAIIDHIECVTEHEPVIRIGWANTEGFIPYPGGGEGWGANGVGDDLFSYGFDGSNLWTAGKPKLVRTKMAFQKGDVVGCLLDLSVPQMSFTVNGLRIKGFFRDFNLDGMFYPVISISAKVSIRFMLGGDHGKLKYGPPEGHAHLNESLLPKDVLNLYSCFQPGDLPRGMVTGPVHVTKHFPFVPQPVDTTNVQLPTYIENVREKLAENIHELWAMGKIEQGWTYNDRRDDQRRYHPCLTMFERLPGNERAYNIALAHETLKTLLSLGYHVAYDPQYVQNNRIKTIKLNNNYLQPNGYKPQPLDLSGVELSKRMLDLVSLLAENTHNVWAKERIRQGWTYGLNEDPVGKRSPHLVKYGYVADSIKAANRQTSSEIVKTLLMYGYSLEPPTNEHGESALQRDTLEIHEEPRVYRAEQTYAVDSGKWYFEFEVLTPGMMQVGWAQVHSFKPGTQVGAGLETYAFDGFAGRKWHNGSEAYGKVWQKADVIGCMLDTNDKTISFSLNGELMMDRMGQEIAFKAIDTSEPFVPVLCLHSDQVARLNFGQDVSSLKYFTCCGLQEGYQPFCVNMTKPMPLWYAKELATFVPMKDHPRLELLKTAGGSTSPPALRIHSTTYGTLESVQLEFLRLSLPVRCHAQFTSPRERADMEREARLNQANRQQEEEGEAKKRLFKKKPTPKDDTDMDAPQGRKNKPRHLEAERRVSEGVENGHNGFLGVPKQPEVTGSKQSLLGKIDGKLGKKRGKSPFKSPFKKGGRPKSREESPEPVIERKGRKPRPGHLGSSTEDDEDVQAAAAVHSKPIHKVNSEGSYASVDGGGEDVEYDAAMLEARMDQVDEYYYGVRILPGQDPFAVHVGWVMPGFHMFPQTFEMKKIRNVIVCTLDFENQLKSSVSRKNCYLVNAGDLQHRYGSHEDSSKRGTPGVLIGCHINISTGVLSFTLNGKEVANKFQVEPEALLFPAVFTEPTNKEMLQFELGRTKNALPLSAALFRGGKHVQPQMPPRLEVQYLVPFQWSRVPITSNKVHHLKLSDIRGWSMLAEDAMSMLAIHIPEEDRSYDILELIERPELLEFHSKTLDLYQSVCSHGNHRVAHELTHHVDSEQLQYCLHSKYMPGPLRMGYHNLLISLHLDSHAQSRDATQREFIIPLSFKTDEFMLFAETEEDTLSSKIKSTIPSLESSVSVRPVVDINELKARVGTEEELRSSPFFDLDYIRQSTMCLLAEAVENGGAHIRDPLGGTNATLFVPIVRVIDNLLMMGLITDSDLENLLKLIDPASFDPNYHVSEDENEDEESVTNRRPGLLLMKQSNPVKLELCRVLHHLTDAQLRHRVEAITAYGHCFVSQSQVDQLERYNEIKQAEMPLPIAAKKTKEFRCPAKSQMQAILAFRKEDLENPDPSSIECPCSEDLQNSLKNFHSTLLNHCGYTPPVEEEGEVPAEEAPPLTWTEKILALVASHEEKKEEEKKPVTDSMSKLIIATVTRWAKTDYIHDQDLIRNMFSLIYRQYDAVEELKDAMESAYVISEHSKEDIVKLLHSLGIVRSLLPVQVAPDEEEILKTRIWELADNRVFFQHPDLMRALACHETVMQLMINTMTKAQHTANIALDVASRQDSISTSSVTDLTGADAPKDSAADMVVACCRFLCYFCRTGPRNQRAMFEHLSYLLENSCMLLARPSLRGSCPLDVAYSSLMDNNELALALRESDLDKVAVYLSRSGQQANGEILAKGYPNVGWDPVEGERFLDFFRFCVWVNGESVEENANLVVRLLIRRPETLGPALRGEGGGLYKAIEDGILLSMQTAASRDPHTMSFLLAVTQEEDDERGNYLIQSKYDFSTLPPEDDEDYIDMGASIVNFYSSLTDLLGRCAPDAETIKAGRSDSLRARAILRSLISMEDLEGVLGLRFILPQATTQEIMNESGEMETVDSVSAPPGLQSTHKAAIVLFMERVYGIADQQTLFRVLENGFLPDLRAANTLDDMSLSDSDVALGLNRYLCGAVLPLLSSYCHFFQDADHATSLLDSTLHTVYRLSKSRCLTKIQRDIVSDFLVSYTSQLRPPMMTSLLRTLVLDVPALTDNTIVALRLLTNHYERCGRYYGSRGWGAHGTSTEEEKRITMMLFSGIFDSLAKRPYDPELFAKALPCLTAIGCALPPDYSLSGQDEGWFRQFAREMNATYQPSPADISRVRLNEVLAALVKDFAEHYHDAWSMEKIEQGWTCGKYYDEDKKTHPNLKAFGKLSEKDKQSNQKAIDESLRSMVAWGWTVEVDATRTVTKSQIKRKISTKLSVKDYTPRPCDLRNVTLTRAMLDVSERLAENSHDLWAKSKKEELDAVGGGIHPQMVSFNDLTDKERKKHRERAQEIVRFIQVYGFTIISPTKDARTKTMRQTSKSGDAEGGVASSATGEKRFAYSLLEKLVEYVDKASLNMKQTRPASRFSRRHSHSTATEDVKFFGKVVLPLVERLFRSHKMYFITNPLQSQTASIKEKEMTASLFSKLALLLRQRITAFGHDTQISVRCLQTLVQAIDARAVVRNSPEVVRSSLLPFLTHAADDLSQTVQNLKVGRFSHVKGTIMRGATSLNYVHMVLLPVLTSMFDHLGRNDFGADLLVGELQLCCYKILNALYTLGTSSSTFVKRDSIMLELSRHRPLLGECVASFASTFPVAFLEPLLNMYNNNSIVYGIPEEDIATHSLEAKEVFDQVAGNVPSLEGIVEQIALLADSGGKYKEAPHLIEVTLPMLCSYLQYWWSHGPDNVDQPEEGMHTTSVTTDLMNGVLGNVLKLIQNNIGSPEAPWMTRIATRTQPIIVNATPEMLRDHILPVADKLKGEAQKMEKEEYQFVIDRRSRLSTDQDSSCQRHYQILVRDIYAFYPLLIKYTDLHRSHWLKQPSADTEDLYLAVAEVFNLWSKSHIFQKEEQNFVWANEIDNMALIMPSTDKSLLASSEPTDSVSSGTSGGGRKKDEKRRRNVRQKMEVTTSLNVACLKRLLPIGLNMFGGQEQELVQQAKERLISKETEADIEDFLRLSLESEVKTVEDESSKWQKQLYKKIGSRKDAESATYTLDASVTRVLAMAKVLYGLHLVEHPPQSRIQDWKKIVSSQRKRAVMACFRMVPLHSYASHRAINLFLTAYKSQWLEHEGPGHLTLVDDVTCSVENEEEKEDDEVEAGPQPLGQLITAFSRASTVQSAELLGADKLYIKYANIMCESCHGGEEEEGDDEAEEGSGPTLQEQEMDKQKLLKEQGRLADRGAAEMVLMYISACKGSWSDMVIATIELGISILRGGNVDVQSKMLSHLRDKKDVGFFMSVAGLMQQCSVLDLDAFERFNKAEGLGTPEGQSVQTKILSDAEDICKLFRFLQLLCEGHNLEFQNYLRTQAGNTTTVNIIISTVDYLLRLQESMMDFYWHYSNKDTIDPSGKEGFCRAITVSAQVFASITEYIQGPCAGNQLALAHSRLWDAVGGFLYIFAHMQDKLSKDPEQLDLLREFMGLQKEMMIMLLSMLEGNVMNGPIGKQMVDTLVESSANFEMILKFFDIFLKMKDVTDADAFKEFDANGDGFVSPREFRLAMGDMKVYTEEEIEYIMLCVDANQDGKVDFHEFTDRFHNPAKDIGFNVAVLLTNLSEHMPSDPRMQKFMEISKSVLDYFAPYLGRIEIMGSAGRIERVYFEIKQSHIDQWEKPQIKDSKRQFLHNIISEDGGDVGKLETFVNFCEDTIFEMQHAASISPEEQNFSFSRMFSSSADTNAAGEQTGIMDFVKSGWGLLKSGLWFTLSCLSPINIRDQYRRLRSMTLRELVTALIKLILYVALSGFIIIIKIVGTLVRFIYNMMVGEKGAEPARRDSLMLGKPAVAAGYSPLHLQAGKPSRDIAEDEVATAGKGVVDAFGNSMAKTTDGDGEIHFKLTGPDGLPLSSHVDEAAEDADARPEETTEKLAEASAAETDKAGKSRASGAVASVEFEDDILEGEGDQAAPEAAPEQAQNDFSGYILSLFARNFYNFKILALALAFLINFILLFFKATRGSGLFEGAEEEAGEGAGDEGEEEEDPQEWVQLAENLSYLGPFLRGIALLHTFISFATLIAYYHLKVPLVVFKREKEVCRNLEFDGKWVTDQVGEDDMAGHWDKLSISTRSFPDKYWDKFIKKKVRTKYAEQYDFDQITELLGMEASDAGIASPVVDSVLPAFLAKVDFQYEMWKWGIIFTDNSFLYCVWYFVMSALGNYNYFFFASHLLDVAVSVKTLGTILQSVTHNGKQLVLTVMLLSIVVYLYTVIAFIFFRKFYVQEEENNVDYKCHDMLTCYVFHLYVGVRAGGGIGDEIESPDGDPYEVYRILFDVTFFFFIVVILLAIIQGLIIDAFGELRDQLEQVREDLESSCFICAIGKDYFDKTPHGFETHVMNEHNFANYMFFLMHLINKPDTEYTGQESYVYEMYCQRCWDFFPAGDCFRKQYEAELSPS